MGKHKLKSIEELETELEALRVKRKPIETAMTRLYAKLKTAKQVRDIAKIKEMEADGPDWDFLMQSQSDFSSIELYNYFNKLIYEMGMSSNGRIADTYQPYVELKITYNSAESITKNTEGVKFLSKLYTKDDDGFIPFGVSEHTLSEFGSYSIKYNPEIDEVILNKMAYHRLTEKPLGKLDEAMKYLNEHHWYDGKDTDVNF